MSKANRFSSEPPVLESALRAEARAKQRARDELLLSEHERIAIALANSEYGEAELARAREQVGKWERDQTCSLWYVRKWSQILLGAPGAVAERMRAIAPEERMALVQNTPFGFLLADQVRG